MASQIELERELDKTIQEETELKRQLDQVDKELMEKESQSKKLKEKAKGTIKKIRALDSDYFHFKIKK